jgi:enoyl-CoA hydratase
MTDEDGELVTARHGAVLVLRLNRPKARNALTRSLLSQIGAAVAEAEVDPQTRVVVLTATGDRAFCAGMDLRGYDDGSPLTDEIKAGLAAHRRMMRGQIGIPLVGAANATALGGGFELLLCCDIIVASDQARFGFPEVTRGLYPGGGGTSIGARIPMALAMELLLTGDVVGAARVQDIGLVNSVVPADDVLSAALAVAGRIARNAPLGLAATKELVRLSVFNAAEAEAREPKWQSLVFGSEDAKEGAMAFIEKREPEWKGR